MPCVFACSTSWMVLLGVGMICFGLSAGRPGLTYMGLFTCSIPFLFLLWLAATSPR